MKIESKFYQTLLKYLHNHHFIREMHCKLFRLTLRGTKFLPNWKMKKNCLKKSPFRECLNLSERVKRTCGYLCVQMKPTFNQWERRNGAPTRSLGNVTKIANRRSICHPSIIKTINKIQNAHKCSLHVFHFQLGIELTSGNAAYPTNFLTPWSKWCKRRVTSETLEYIRVCVFVWATECRRRLRANKGRKKRTKIDETIFSKEICMVLFR